VVIPAGNVAKLLRLVPRLNGEMGTNREVSLSLTTNANYQLSTSDYVSVVIVDQEGDSDGDGMSNAAESLAGTDPNNADSSLKVLSLANDASGQLVLNWASVPGVTYEVMACDSLTSASWIPVSSGITATGEISSWSISTDHAVAFFAIRVKAGIEN
jgi:hypothetical protein